MSSIINVVYSFRLESQTLRELYAYCWYVPNHLFPRFPLIYIVCFSARVAHTKVERQLKIANIPCAHINPAAAGGLPTGLARMQSSLINSIPALCVKSSDLLSSAEGVEAAMPNIRIIPLHWWADQRMEVRLGLEYI